MFVLSIIKVWLSSSRLHPHRSYQDTIPVLPANFGPPRHQAITDEINKKYANKVLHDVGLCICMFDLVEVGEGKVRYGDGCLWYKSPRRSLRYAPSLLTPV